MANNVENLRVPTSEEAREIGKKGGIASGKARRKKKELKQILELLLSQPCLDGSGEDNYTQMCVAQIQKALEGDTKAFTAVRDTIGQKPVDKVDTEISSKTKINITIEE